MPYFSRLTDIVTCNLSSILEQADDPRIALEEILFEMQEGVAGAERSVKTADANVCRLEVEIGEQRLEIASWVKTAQQALTQGQEGHARQALQRKHEVEDLIAGLEQQLEAAISTRDHLRTMLSALQARQADARRRLLAIDQPEANAPGAIPADPPATTAVVADRQNRIEAELEALRQQLAES